MTYTIYQSPGWHGKPDDPVIWKTDDEREAALRAGMRVDIGMPGESNKYDAYAVDDETGMRVEPIESFRCDRCGALVEWGESGPTGCMDGKVLDCPQAVPKHLVEWVCDDCALEYEIAEDNDDD